MIPILILLATGAVAAVPASGSPAPAEAAHDRMRTVLAGAELRTLDGTFMTVPALAGEVLVFNFWATWCAPCRRELPDLDALHTEIAGRGGRVLAVAIDHDARNVRSFVRRYRLSLPVFHDGPDGLARTLDLPHVPYTVVLDRNGRIAYVGTGSDAQALAALRTATLAQIARKPIAFQSTEGTRP